MIPDISKASLLELKDLVGLVFRTPPVGVIEFVESSKYMNKGGSYLYPKIKDILERIFDTTVREADANLGRGAGKSELATNFLAYSLYWLDNLISPHSFYQLNNKTLISVINLGLSIPQASSVIFDNLGGMIEDAPYFKDKVKMRSRDIYVLGRRIRAISGHSGSTAWRGYHIYAGVLDEINFFLDKKGHSNAEKLHGVIKGSMSTRFPDGYKLLSISSTDHDDDFLSRHRKDIQENGGVVVDLP